MAERDDEALTYERLTGIASKLRVIARVVELRRNGETHRAIAELLNLHEDTVGKYLAIVGAPPRPRGPFARRNARLREDAWQGVAR